MLFLSWYLRYTTTSPVFQVPISSEIEIFLCSGNEKRHPESLSFFEMTSDVFYIILCFYLRSIDVLERAGMVKLRLLSASSPAFYFILSSESPVISDIVFTSIPLSRSFRAIAICVSNRTSLFDSSILDASSMDAFRRKSISSFT